MGWRIKGLAARQRAVILIWMISIFLFLGMGNASPGMNMISGMGSGELLLSVTIADTVPVFSGSYSYDISSINIPPISTPLNVTGSKSGYAYNLSGVYMPNKPNDFRVSASKVKDLNIGLKKDPVKEVFNQSRIWVTTQIPADENGTATALSDLLSPGRYHAKIFGEAAENVTAVDLTMTLTKKLIVEGRFAFGIDTEGFPSGNYSIAAKALNGSFRFEEINLERGYADFQ
jgi:hypothetical protein